MDIGLLLYERCIPSGCMAFADLLEIANRRCGQNVFSVHWLGLKGGFLNFEQDTSKAKLSITVQPLAEAEVGELLVPGMWLTSPKELGSAVDTNQSLIQALKQVPISVPVHGYCTAVALLAESGRLEGSKATSTWWMTGFLTQQYNQVDWSFDKTLVESKRGITASGIHGYLPIALALIRQHCGEKKRARGNAINDASQTRASFTPIFRGRTTCAQR